MRMATEADGSKQELTAVEREEEKMLTGKKEKTPRLTLNRPSHGRTVDKSQRHRTMLPEVNLV